MADFADYYREIYARGLGGERPDPGSMAELERRAAEALEDGPPATCGAAPAPRTTMGANLEAFAPPADRAAHAARRRRARPLRDRARDRRCPPRCCWRRSACR